MFLIALAFICALSISGVAIYYSVIGLAAIFAAAKVPIYIMGGVLEVAKLVTASWLYQNWKNIPFLLKTYLTTAVFVLMIITSLGIFGFLSKAHIEQATPAANIVAEISNFEERILREETKITNLTAKIDRLNSGETVGADDQLVREQAIIENAQNKIVSSVELIQTQISNTQQQITDIQTDADKKIALIKEDVPSKIEAEQNKLKQLDDAVSAILNSNKAFFNEEKAASELRATQKPERDAIANNINKIQSTADNEVKDTQTATTKQIDPLRAKIDGFNSEISALQASINQEVLLAKQRINEINQKAIDQGEDSAELVKQYELDINTAYDVIDQYNGDKFVLEAQIRELSAEVGPIKYIAQFFDRDGDVDLERAVTWLIVIIMFVFDPLAVLLLIAVNMSLKARYGWTFEGETTPIGDRGKIVEKIVTVEADVDVSTPPAITKLEQKVEKKLYKGDK
jgi:hypothetical protein|tara:strand:+ start:2522 stop:3895 length:1374 start_codon:yes stop_codon:yes gene_type:complete